MKQKVDRLVDEHFLKFRVGDGRYGVSMWILFCREMLKRGYKVRLKEAKNTVSKYITVYGINDDYFLVRFSNHKPIKSREANEDCDFFVGVTNFKVTNTGQAIEATLKHFGAR